MWRRLGVVTLVLLGIPCAAVRARGDDDANGKGEEAKPIAIHRVMYNKAGEKIGESWVTTALGTRIEGLVDAGRAITSSGKESVLRIDDGRRGYVHLKDKNLVEVNHSFVRKPFWPGSVAYHAHGSSWIKLMEQQPEFFGKFKVTVTEEVRNGRKVKRALAVREWTKVEVKSHQEREIVFDAETDRILEEVDRLQPAGSFMRTTIEHLDPSKVDKRLFVFEIPPGAIVQEWVPLKADDDAKVEDCIEQLRFLVGSVMQNGPFKNRPPSFLLRGSAFGRGKCPADPDRETPGRISYIIANDVPIAEMTAPKTTVVLECRHHGPKLIVACGDGHVQINPK